MEANVSKFGSAEPDTIWDKYNERQQVISKAAAYIEKKNYFCNITENAFEKK